MRYLVPILMLSAVLSEAAFAQDTDVSASPTVDERLDRLQAFDKKLRALEDAERAQLGRALDARKRDLEWVEEREAALTTKLDSIQENAAVGGCWGFDNLIAFIGLLVTLVAPVTTYIVSRYKLRIEETHKSRELALEDARLRRESSLAKEEQRHAMVKDFLDRALNPTLNVESREKVLRYLTHWKDDETLRSWATDELARVEDSIKELSEAKKALENAERRLVELTAGQRPHSQTEREGVDRADVEAARMLYASSADRLNRLRGGGSPLVTACATCGMPIDKKLWATACPNCGTVAVPSDEISSRAIGIVAEGLVESWLLGLLREGDHLIQAGEVDFLIARSDSQIPVEVKYTNSRPSLYSLVNGVTKIMARRDDTPGLLVVVSDSPDVVSAVYAVADKIGSERMGVIVVAIDRLNPTTAAFAADVVYEKLLNR